MVNSSNTVLAAAAIQVAFCKKPNTEISLPTHDQVKFVAVAFPVRAQCLEI
jgi:hypothetical protein